MDIKIHVTKKHEGCTVDVDATCTSTDELAQVLEACAPVRRKFLGIV